MFEKIYDLKFILNFKECNLINSNRFQVFISLISDDNW